MTCIVIFGNSGSGKSTLAKSLSNQLAVPHLDLDTIAWQTAGVRAPLASSLEQLTAFYETNPHWVIEGCYSSLLIAASEAANALIFLNPGVETCQANCRRRPWEPHKYRTKDEQDANLNMLLSWIATYEERNDEFSRSAHQKIFDSFQGKKWELLSNSDAARIGDAI